MNLPSIQPWLLLTDIGEETLVYDRVNLKAHNLNPTAALVFHHCAKASDFSETKQALAERSMLDISAAEELLTITLKELEEQGLLATAAHKPKLDRRDFLKKWGTAAAVLPLIVSMSPPAAAVSASGCDCSGLPGTPTVTINAVRTCVSGTLTHSFDLTASTANAGCQICQYAYDIDSDGTFDFTSPSTATFNVTYSAGPDISATLRIQGPCGASDIRTQVIGPFPRMCP